MMNTAYTPLMLSPHAYTADLPESQGFVLHQIKYNKTKVLSES